MEEEWPPFRKMGSFDPYTDDYRLAVKKVEFCGKSGRLMVGGTAGQVVSFDLNVEGEPKEETITATLSTLVTDKDGFTWKGHAALAVKPNDVKIPVGFQPSSILQLAPPASINSIGKYVIKDIVVEYIWNWELYSHNYHLTFYYYFILIAGYCHEWNLMAAGTAHGLVVYDCLQNNIITTKCTLNAQGNNNIIYGNINWILKV